MKLYKVLIKSVFLLLPLSFLCGCSVSRFIPEDHYLLTGTSIGSLDNQVKSDELQAFMPQRPNNKWFSIFKVPLGIYALSGRDSSKAINRFVRHLGEAPVIYDPRRTLQACENMKQNVRNQGYLNAEVLASEQIKGRHIKVRYRVIPGERYHIRNFMMNVEDSLLARCLDTLGYHPAMAVANEGVRTPYSITELDAERSRLYGKLVENGYYKFNKEFISYRVDTTVGQRQADVTMIVRRHNAGRDSLHHRFHYGSISYEFPSGKAFLRPKVLQQATAIASGDLYRESTLHETYSRLTRLSAMLSANVRTSPRSDDSDTLDVNIALMPNKLHNFGVQLEGTNSAGDLGAAVALSYKNRNLFRGSEMFSIKLRGAFEAIKGLSGYADQNYIEWSAETGLTFPDFKLPFLRSSFRRNAQATTEINVSFDSQDRPEFHRRVLNSTLRYRWGRHKQQLQHRFDLLNINYVFMPWISDTFRRLYLDDPTNRNAILRYNYENLFIVNWSYHFAYNSRPLGAASSNYGTNAYTIRLSVETAGNLLQGITALAGTGRNEYDQSTLFGIAFAQYAKLDFAFCKSFLFNKNNSLALHAAFGIACPYGNSNILPYEKRYFSGGANSVRGWSVRELGPGSFRGTDGRIDFINQTGDIKLDLNLEYRTHLFWKLDGAAFIDAGNIWTIRNYEEQPGGQFRIDEFWKQIAVAYGLGLRLNFGYFILRFDGGMKAIHPAYTDSRHFPIVHPNFKRDFTFHFAVGMPF